MTGRRRQIVITHVGGFECMGGIGIEAFEKLTRDQAERPADLLDERVLYEYRPVDSMRELAGSDFGDDDFYDLAALYASFMRRLGDVTWPEGSDSAGDLSAAKRQLYEEIAERVTGKADAGKVREYSALSTAIFYGHPSMYEIMVFTEFRPVSGERGMAHLVPCLVVDGTARDFTDGPNLQIKMRLDPNDAEKLAKDIASGLKALTAQIAEMQEKFKDDAVHA